LQEKRQKTLELENTARQLESTREELSRAEKFAKLGKMLAGIAHELNNRLSPIMVYSQMLIQSEYTADPKFKRRVLAIEKAAQRAKDIAQTLLDFSRPVKVTLMKGNINDLINEVISSIEYYFVEGSKYSLDLQLNPQLPDSEFDRELIGHVLLNMINNALQAMEESGGTLTIVSDRAGDDVIIRISDTGVGIPEDEFEHIFEPFYTTKQIGKGTGLGLSISYNIIKAHRGDISLESRLGEETTFTIRLPLKVGEAPAGAGGLIMEAACGYKQHEQEEES